MTKHKLPNKPSQLIRTALADFKAVERLKGYEVDMSVWHAKPTVYTGDGKKVEEAAKCAVCFAGSVMARTLKVKPDDSVELNDFDNDTENKLRALESFRTGGIADAFTYLDIAKPDPEDTPFKMVMYIPDEVDVAEYALDPSQFKKDMAKLADNLKMAGF